MFDIRYKKTAKLNKKLNFISLHAHILHFRLYILYLKFSLSTNTFEIISFYLFIPFNNKLLQQRYRIKYFYCLWIKIKSGIIM